MKFREIVTVVATILIATPILIHYVNGCDVCTIRNGTDTRPVLKPSSSGKEERAHFITPLILPSSIAVMAIVMMLVKNKRRR
ncbi:hypothetical protein KEJ27_05200 [Candidatus Bathyarchaeota archaeon]|nr:hypothetical protein [Candidatus Bathyarchaeota archaeon]MBS7618219.1 hypothetical protein [Candidatus Bathyarchaeota archaeon]